MLSKDQLVVVHHFSLSLPLSPSLSLSLSLSLFLALSLSVVYKIFIIYICTVYVENVEYYRGRLLHDS
jgi:hypothetical protein